MRGGPCLCLEAEPVGKVTTCVPKCQKQQQQKNSNLKSLWPHKTTTPPVCNPLTKRQSNSQTRVKICSGFPVSNDQEESHNSTALLQTSVFLFGNNYPMFPVSNGLLIFSAMMTCTMAFQPRSPLASFDCYRERG